MPRVAIYCRLSDEDFDKANPTDESESIQNQKSQLTRYAVEQGWDIYGIYVDEDYTGMDRTRPDFNKMLKEAEQGKFDIILCKHQSRFTRDAELVEKYLHRLFLEWNIRFISLTDNVDTANKGNKKSRQINGLVNEWYLEDLSENVRAAFDIKRKEGKFIGSFACYGYMKDPNNKNKLIIDENVADVVRYIFNLYVDGYGTQTIAYKLNEQGIVNPTKYKQSQGLKFINSFATDDIGLWNKTTVKRILKNEIYIGNMVQGIRRKVSYKSKKVITVKDPKEWYVVENTHPAIIDKEIFDYVQKILKNNTRSSGNGKPHLLANKVRCMDCGKVMNKVSAFHRTYIYLRCQLYARGKKLCTSHAIRLDELENFILSKLKERINQYLDELSTIDYLDKNLTVRSNQDNKKEELAKVNRLIEEKKKYSKNLYLDKLKGVITEDQFVEFNNMFIAEREQLEKRKATLEHDIELLSTKSDTEKETYAKVQKYKNINQLTHVIVNDLIDYVEIGEKNKTTNEQEIVIHWLF